MPPVVMGRPRGIKLPLLPKRKGRKPKYPWRKMEIGANFKARVPITSISKTKTDAERATGFKFTCRQVPGGTKVWRIK